MKVTHIVGIDAGGSGSRIVAGPVPSPGPVRSSDGPGANLQVLGTNGTAKILSELIRDVYAGPLSALVVVAGVAGAGRPEDRTALGAALAARLRLDGPRVRILSDAELTLDAAFGPDREGMIVIAGTGSIVSVRGPDGSVTRAGGWGRLLGDQGGGYAIGIAGLSAVADAIDGGPDTALVGAASRVWRVREASDLVSAVYREKRNPAAFAPAVLDAADAGDAVAARIVTDQAAALALRALWAAGRATCESRRIALWGGLVRNEPYRRELVAAIGSALPEWSVEIMESRPVDAAIERARLMADALGGAGSSGE